METPIILEECHLEAVCALEKKYFSHPWSEEQFLEALHSPHYNLCGYIKENQVLVYLLTSTIDDYCEIINIATDKEHRRKGYAYQVLDYFFKEAGNTHTVLEVRSQNIAAQELYKKFGFTQIHIRKNYYDDDDALVMERSV